MSALIDFISQDFQRSDVIALGALLVGCLAAIYARRQVEEARMARLAATREGRRPLRLKLLRTTRDFCVFCCSYYTLYLMNGVNGTRELCAKISAFALEVEEHGPLDMQEVEVELKELQLMAWSLQQHLDRLGSQRYVISAGVLSNPDEVAVHALVDKFGSRRKELQAIFAPYISEA